MITNYIISPQKKTHSASMCLETQLISSKLKCIDVKGQEKVLKTCRHMWREEQENTKLIKSESHNSNAH